MVYSTENLNYIIISFQFFMTYSLYIYIYIYVFFLIYYSILQKLFNLKSWFERSKQW